MHLNQQQRETLNNLTEDRLAALDWLIEHKADLQTLIQQA